MTKNKETRDRKLMCERCPAYSVKYADNNSGNLVVGCIANSCPFKIGSVIEMDEEIKCIYCDSIMGSLIRLTNGWCCAKCFKEIILAEKTESKEPLDEPISIHLDGGSEGEKIKVLGWIKEEAGMQGYRVFEKRDNKHSIGIIRDAPIIPA